MFSLSSPMPTFPFPFHHTASHCAASLPAWLLGVLQRCLFLRRINCPFLRKIFYTLWPHPHPYIRIRIRTSAERHSSVIVCLVRALLFYCVCRCAQISTRLAHKSKNITTIVALLSPPLPPLAVHPLLKGFAYVVVRLFFLPICTRHETKQLPETRRLLLQLQLSLSVWASVLGQFHTCLDLPQSFPQKKNK